MQSKEEMNTIMETLRKKDRELAFEIRLVSAWIMEHRGTRPPKIDAPSSCPDERNEYRAWRKVSCQLHQRRSELKTKQENIQARLLAAGQSTKERDTGFLNFPIIPGMDLEADPTTANALA